MRLIVFGLIGLFWIGGGIYNYLKFPEQTKIIPIFICLLGVGLVGIGFRNFLLNKNVSKKIMKNKLLKIVFLLLTANCSLLTVNAQTPTVEKVEPPSWWTNSSIKTVRVMLRGTNFSNTAKVLAPAGSGLKADNIKASANGHYLFFDVTIAENTKVGKYNFKIQTEKGFTDAPFEIFQPLPRTGNFQGFLPDDVIYFLMPDRFADGDTANNDPAKSKGLYDRKMGRSYHGGDLQGVINKLDYIK